MISAVRAIFARAIKISTKLARRYFFIHRVHVVEVY